MSAGQHDEEMILLRNLINRITRNDRTGLYSLKGDITDTEIGALKHASTIFRHYNLGELVQRTAKS